MILSLTKFLNEDGNEDLRRQFHHKLVYGGYDNPKSFLELLNSTTSRKDRADARARVTDVWTAVCAASHGTAQDVVSTLAQSLDEVPLDRLASQTSLSEAYGVDTNIVCVLVTLLLDHEAYLQAVLEYPTMLETIKGMIFAMSKDHFLEARRAATWALKVVANISDYKLNTTVRTILQPLSKLLLPEGQHLLANSTEAAQELHQRAKEAHIARTPVMTSVGELVHIDLRQALIEFSQSDVFDLFTPEFDDWKFEFLLCFDTAGVHKKGAEIGSSSTPLILVPTGIRALSSSTAAVILVALTNVTDKDHLNLREVLDPVREAIAACSDLKLRCPHTGRLCSVSIKLALDGAAWLIAANTKGAAADVGKLAHSTANSADIADPQLHLPSTTDASFGEMTEEIHKGRSTEQRKKVAGETGGSMGRALFTNIPACEIRRGSLHLFLTPVNWVWTQTCLALSEGGCLEESGDFMAYLRTTLGLDVERIVTRDSGPFIKVHGGHGGRRLLAANESLFITGARDASWGGVEHPAHDLCICLAEVWKALFFLVDLVRAIDVAKFERMLPDMHSHAQLLVELCDEVFGKHTPYISSFTNIVLQHCWEAHMQKTTYNRLFDDSTVEMMHYELSEMGIAGHGGGRAGTK